MCFFPKKPHRKFYLEKVKKIESVTSGTTISLEKIAPDQFIKKDTRTKCF